MASLNINNHSSQLGSTEVIGTHIIKTSVRKPYGPTLRALAAEGIAVTTLGTAIENGPGRICRSWYLKAFRETARGDGPQL